MVDDKNTPPNLEEPKKPADEVTLDINAFDDEDIFAEGPADPVDDFSFLEEDKASDNGLDIAADVSNSYQDSKQEKDLALEQDLFDVGHDDDLFGENSPKRDDEELFADIFDTPADDDIFGDFKEPEVQPTPARAEPIMMESTYGEDRDTFSSDAFDDVNADFPDSEGTIDLGDDQLFDYDASSTDAHDAALDDDIFSAPKGPGTQPKGGPSFAKTIESSLSKIKDLFHPKKKEGGATPPVQDQAVKTKRIVRTAALLILVVLVYSLLRFINPGVETTVANNDDAPDIDKIAKFDLSKAQPVKQQENPPAEPPPAPVEELKPTVEEAKIEVTTTLTPAVEATPAEPALAEPAPTPVVAAVELSAEEKVKQLEAALSAMDQKLATLNTQSQTNPMTNLGLDSMNPNDANAAATKQILSQALQRIDELDKKLLLLAELQKEMKSLSNQLQNLKSDVVQQSMIVGQAQREINTGIQSFKMDNPEPVRMMVQAAIPGRAWLRSETGELYTVIPGDEVPGYGKVVSIDAGTGTVIMSSRAVIREQF